MYFEIYKQGNLVKRGNRILNDIDFSNEPMSTPEVSLELPIDYLEYIAGREQIKLYVNNKCFWGIVKDIEVDKNAEKVNISVLHHIDEWNNRQVSINNAISDKTLNVVMLPSGGQSTDMIVRIYPRNNIQLIGYKLRLKYSDFKGKNKEYVENWVQDYVRQHKTVKAYNLETRSELTNRPALVKTNLKYKAYATKKGKRLLVGTYVATFEFDIGGNKLSIKVPLTVSYSVTHSGSKEPQEINYEPEVQDTVDSIINDANFAYYGWDVNFDEVSENSKISYVYSMQSKYEALTKTVDLTDNLFWRVDFKDAKNVDIGVFGEKKPYALTTHTSNNHNPYIKEHNIQILEEPTIDYDFENVVNVATVLSEKSDSGASCMTLRDLYNMQAGNKKGLKLRAEFSSIWNEFKKLVWKDGIEANGYLFPIFILRDANYTKVNDERNYGYADSDTIGYSVDIFAEQSPSVAPNTSREYGVIDYESVAMENGEIIEGVYNFNDMSPVTDTGVYNEDGILVRKNTKKLTDKDRIMAELVVYKRAIKQLKQARRNYSATMKVSELPADINVGDKIRLVYTNRIWNLDACSNYWKKLIQKDDWYYVTKINYNIDQNGGEVDTITVSKQLKIERETENNGY